MHRSSPEGLKDYPRGMFSALNPINKKYLCKQDFEKKTIFMITDVMKVEMDREGAGEVDRKTGILCQAMSLIGERRGYIKVY